ncbi:unnamed protein product [Auanema sp. JU1783]|nr:unnamed protein product [Auanema sp. JU1783]
MMLLLVVLTSFLPLSYSIPQFDNEIKDKPLIQCSHGHIALDVETLHSAPAHVFAKGHYKKEGCSFSNTTHVIFDFANCDVRRKREVNPRGMSYSMTVVVQLHPLFVTKVDRAFHVHCFYQETEKAVGTGMNITDPTAQTINGTEKNPECEYTLHKDSANGPLARYAQVGDTIYHVWSCSSESYAMLVHNCTINDGQGSQHKVIDENGCSTDDYLMPELIYSDQLTKSFTASNAFNFPDQNTVSFNCQIKLCIKGTEECERMVPPRCGALNGQNDDPMKNELDQDQLITSTPSSTTQAPTTSSSPSTTTTTQAPSTTSSTTIESSTIITTTVTEISSTSAPETTTVIIPADSFPTPSDIKRFVERKQNDSIEESEGSGLEIAPEAKTPISLIVADEETGRDIYLRPEHQTAFSTSSPHTLDESATTAKREIRRRDTVLDVDITSPELTIVDKEYAGQADAPEALKSVSSLIEHKPNTVCVPVVVVWILSALGFFFSTFLFVACYYAQRQKNKFRMLP